MYRAFFVKSQELVIERASLRYKYEASVINLVGVRHHNLLAETGSTPWGQLYSSFIIVLEGRYPVSNGK